MTYAEELRLEIEKVAESDPRTAESGRMAPMTRLNGSPTRATTPNGRVCLGGAGSLVVLLSGVACSDPAPAQDGSSTSGGQGASSSSDGVASGGSSDGVASGGSSDGAASGGSGSNAVAGGTGGALAGSGSANGAGGEGVGGSPAAGGMGASGTCDFEVSHSLSENIGTVGIVEFSVNLSDIEEANIEFGLDTDYGMTAPVDLAEPNYRTLLLGMKTDSEYHFRITAKSGAEECRSADFTLTTDPRPEDVVAPEITTPLPEERSDGFLITSRWGNDNGGPAFILDADNDLVWWFFAPIDIMRARMSYDGKWMWLRNTAQTDGTGAVMRLSMDGGTEELWELPRTTHDMAVLPDGKIGLISHTDGCDEIVEFDPETESTTTIFNVEEAHDSTNCHVNYLAYSDIDESYYISDFQADDYIKISRSGELQWVLNGEGSTLTGADWQGGQHGIHVLSPDHFVIFNNGAMGGSSLVLEYQLDQSSEAVTELWRYDAGVRAGFGGDVQRLDNGNTLISYSSISLIQEVNPEGDLVQEYAFPQTHTVSYIMKRPTLYGGPPPKIHEF